MSRFSGERFLEGIYYAMRECLNGELDYEHDDLIRWAIKYFEGDKFPAEQQISHAETLALAQAARRREKAKVC